jgi:hypothetical protein
MWTYIAGAGARDNACRTSPVPLALTGANVRGGVANTRGRFRLARSPLRMNPGLRRVQVIFRPTETANDTRTATLVWVRVYPKLNRQAAQPVSAWTVPGRISATWSPHQTRTTRLSYRWIRRPDRWLLGDDWLAGG